MGNLGNERKLEVNVEEIMAEIHERAQQEAQREVNPDCLFDREIDVAGIMRDIRQKVSNCEEIDNWKFENELLKQLKDIYNEIARINTFVLNTRANADFNSEPGRIIPVAASRPLIVQKIFTIMKRFVRKATRFLVLDQMAYNEKISDCVKALCESQEQVIKLTKILAALSSSQMEFQSQVQAEVIRAAESLNELYTIAEKQTAEMNKGVQAQAEINQGFEQRIEAQVEINQGFEQRIEAQVEINQGFEQRIEAQAEIKQGFEQRIEAQAEINQGFEQRIEAQAEINQGFEQQIEAQVEINQGFEQRIGAQAEINQGFEQRIGAQVEINRGLEQRIDALNRQGDMFSASVAKTILEYRKESGLPIEVPREQVLANGQSEAEDRYTILDYFKFQNNFRGSRTLISKRQEMYLPYFKDSKKPVLDIGCGRGEFLSLMKAHKISAFGIDMYPEYVVEGKLNGLDVQQGDGIEFLQNTKQYFGGIFVCQVIEHISFAQLQTLCTAAYEKLVPGGYLVLETPNPRCLAVFAHAFYVDPTHNKPVHPLTLEYLLQEIGFDVKIEYTECTRQEPLPHIQSDEIKNLSQVNAGISRVSDLLFGSGDYAAIAQKPLTV